MKILPRSTTGGLFGIQQQPGHYIEDDFKCYFVAEVYVQNN